MEPIDPRIPPALLPAGSQAVIYGANQPAVLPLPTVRTPLRMRDGDPNDVIGGIVITRWTFTEEEKRRIIQGEDLYMLTQTWGNPFHPVKLSIGIADWDGI